MPAVGTARSITWRDAEATGDCAQAVRTLMPRVDTQANAIAISALELIPLISVDHFRIQKTTRHCAPDCGTKEMVLVSAFD